MAYSVADIVLGSEDTVMSKIYAVPANKQWNSKVLNVWHLLMYILAFGQ